MKAIVLATLLVLLPQVSTLSIEDTHQESQTYQLAAPKNPVYDPIHPPTDPVV
jgi:hypothetical protein